METKKVKQKKLRAGRLKGIDIVHENSISTLDRQITASISIRQITASIRNTNSRIMS
jgi:hypothetical protein